MSTSPAADAENKASSSSCLENLGVAIIKSPEGCCTTTSGFVGAGMRFLKGFDDSHALLRFVKRAGGLLFPGQVSGYQGHVAIVLIKPCYYS